MNVSLHPALGTMLGLTSEHVRGGLDDLKLSQTHVLTAMELMRAYFDGYRFPGVAGRRYTPLQLTTMLVLS